MNKCKRMTVTAIGIKGKYIQKATNYNISECKNIPGQCGCIHAEIALLRKINPKIIIISHSPCINCAKAIIKSDTQIVIYENEYRVKDGIKFLEQKGIKCIGLEQKKPVERLTERELRELMGMNMDKFERRRGAVRRK